MKYTLSSYAMSAMLLFAFAHARAQKESAAKEHMVLISTEYGDIKLKLYNETPLHRDNFLRLAKEGKYNGSAFHRIIKGFMIQGGSTPGSQGLESMGELIPAEIRSQYFHKRGALAAARMGDDVNPEKKSSGSQFYIVHGRTFAESDMDMMAVRMKAPFSEEQRRAYTTIGGEPRLDGNYTVFGEVVEGMEVVDKIAAVEVRGDRPLKEIPMMVKIIE